MVTLALTILVFLLLVIAVLFKSLAMITTLAPLILAPQPQVACTPTRVVMTITLALWILVVLLVSASTLLLLEIALLALALPALGQILATLWFASTTHALNSLWFVMIATLAQPILAKLTIQPPLSVIT